MIVVVAILASAEPLKSQSCETLECRQLFAYCGGIRLVVENLNDDALDIGLNDEWLVSVTESRLRVAGIYDEDALPWLYLNVNVVNQGFNVLIEFRKWLIDPILSEELTASTWSTGTTGVANRTGASFIVQAVTEQLDRFVLKFLRVRDEMCQ